MSQFLKFSKFFQWLSYAKEYQSSFEVCHKLNQVILNWDF